MKTSLGIGEEGWEGGLGEGKPSTVQKSQGLLNISTSGHRAICEAGAC